MTRNLTMGLAAMFLVVLCASGQVFSSRITETGAELGGNCTASGNYSTAMGLNSVAEGNFSTAMGYFVAARGPVSTAIGSFSVALSDQSIVMGKGLDIGNPLINPYPNSLLIAFRMSAIDTTNELFVADEVVGVGTTNPLTRLHVKRNVSGGASLGNHVAAIENTSSETSPDVLALKVNIADPDGGTNFITFRDSTHNLGSIEGNGSGGISLNTSGGDFAEYLPKVDSNETLTPGDVVGLFPEGLSKKTHRAQRIMVVTTAPAVLGNQPKEKDETRYAPVAFLGQVPARVEGAVRSGDYIVPSGCGDGIGRAVPSVGLEPGQYDHVVGRALQTHPDKGIKTVTTLVGLPQNGLCNTAMQAKDARIAQLEERLAALEARSDNSTGLGLLPGAGIIMGSLGFFWVDRRRRRS